MVKSDTGFELCTCTIVSMNPKGRRKSGTSNPPSIDRSAHANGSKINYDAYEVIFYEQPNPKRLQFLALNPLELDISSIDMGMEKKNKVLSKKETEELSNIKKIVQYGRTLNNEINATPDDLEIVLVQVKMHHVEKDQRREPQLLSIDQFVLFFGIWHQSIGCPSSTQKCSKIPYVRAMYSLYLRCSGLLYFDSVYKSKRIYRSLHKKVHCEYRHLCFVLDVGFGRSDFTCA